MITADRNPVIEKLNLSSLVVEKLDRYVSLLEDEQKIMNLIGASTLPDVWVRHILDSAQLFKMIRSSDETILDFGSGAGFPALVLAAMDENKSRTFHLTESEGRKADFLNKVVELCDLKAVVHNERIEQMKRFDTDIITARALAPLDKLIKYALPFCGKMTRCLFMKGAKSNQELQAALKKYKCRVEKIQSITSDEGTILLLSEVKKK